jgi:hypothetical protein
MKCIYLLSIALSTCITTAFAQTTRQELEATVQKTGGNYYAYPDKNLPAPTAPPKGYQPFYISHFGRHGSRFAINPAYYTKTLAALDSAGRTGKLTPLGESVLKRMRVICAQADGMQGSLTRLGERQHRGIAERMYRHYPQVFAKGARITARSTLVPRVIISMAAFSERLKELDPKLYIARDANHRYLRYLSAEDEAYPDYEFPTYSKQVNHLLNHFPKRLSGERLVASLFTDTKLVHAFLKSSTFARYMFNVASDLQDVESPLSLYDIFKPEELFAQWQSSNYNWYVTAGPSPQNKEEALRWSIPLLENILDSADSMIVSGGHGADLRFGHDSNVCPLAALMHFQNCDAEIANPDSVYLHWSNFKIIPMGANIQLVFYRNKKDDVIVKFMLNEHEVRVAPIHSDIFPFYHWRDVETYYRSMMKDPSQW